MATFTPNYGLHQWEPEDSFLRTDFNEDHVKLEAALTGLQAGMGEKSSVVCGGYTGTDALGSSSGQTIELGFSPRLLVLNTGTSTVMPVPGQDYRYVTFTQNGFTVVYDSGNSFSANRSGFWYTYLAVK